MILVDSSGWLEFFGAGPLADDYANYLSNPEQVVTPTVVLYEVYRWIKRQRTEEDALVATAQMQKTRIEPLTETVALTAADLGLEHGLAMADAIVYATALLRSTELVTSDRDFADLPGVTYIEKA